MRHNLLQNRCSLADENFRSKPTRGHKISESKTFEDWNAWAKSIFTFVKTVRPPRLTFQRRLIGILGVAIKLGLCM
jgi:hypothetical protein